MKQDIIGIVYASFNLILTCETSQVFAKKIVDAYELINNSELRQKRHLIKKKNSICICNNSSKIFSMTKRLF